MSRRNVTHDARSLKKLIKEIKGGLDEIESVLKRLEDKKIKRTFSLSHQSPIEEGIISMGRFARSFHLKIDDFEAGHDG